MNVAVESTLTLLLSDAWFEQELYGIDITIRPSESNKNLLDPAENEPAENRTDPNRNLKIQLRVELAESLHTLHTCIIEPHSLLLYDF